jgi:phasin
VISNPADAIKEEFMTKPVYERPEALRDLVDQGVDQTRRAVDAFWQASRVAIGSVEAALPEAARDASQKALGYTEANIRAALDHAQKLTHAKDVEEFWRLQSNYLKGQSLALQEQMKEWSSVPQKASVKQNDKS